MLYMVIALKSEAQAFVDKYKLKKEKLIGFSTFVGSDITIIVCGIGIANAKEATLCLVKNYKLNNDDIFVNVGICAADKKYNIGQLLEIGSIEYNNHTYVYNNLKESITCLNEEATDDKYKIVDMESFGFYDALKDHKHNFYIFKVVSDHFEPSKVTKDSTKKLIFNVIDDILQRIQKC